MHKHHHKHATLAPSFPTGPATTTQRAVTTGDKDHKAPLVSADDIRHCAYRKWESAGKPSGDGISFWLEAEKELLQGK